MILKELVVGMFGSNCFVVGSESDKKGIIIDPGADAGAIMDAVRDTGLSIDLIVATHNHVDHVGALRQVKEATGAPYAVHEADAESVMPDVFGRMLGVMMSRSLKAPPKPDRLLREGDIIDVGGWHFTVLHTPGHTPGSICLLTEDKVFTGDTLFRRGIGTTLMPGSSRPQLLNSIRTRLMALPDDTTIYPGHGRETTIGAERRDNPYVRGSW